MSRVLRGATLPRILAGVPDRGAMDLRSHLATHGPMPGYPGGRGEHPLIGEIERAGLLGRGGAAFPTAIKLRAVAAARGRAVVVVNACEGEPMSFKDRLLLECLPHLVLDGAALAAVAVGADAIVLAVDDRNDRAWAAAEAARDERGGAAVEIVTVPRRYLSGQESALVNFLNGGPAKPTTTPPMVFKRGVRGRPTLMSNAETLAHVALIARHGAEWFRELGTAIDPGSALVTLSGAVARPGVFEIDSGGSLSSLLAAAGGTTARLRAVLVGGYAGTWVDADELAALDVTRGPGIVVALPDSACPVAETARVMHWLAGQNAGQCGPCVHGLDAIAGALAQVRQGAAGQASLERVSRWTQLVRGRGACSNPDGVAAFVDSALTVFAEELHDHLRHGPCDRCAAPPVLSTPPWPRHAAPSGHLTTRRAA